MHHQTKWSHPPSVVCDSTKPLNDDVIQWKHFPRYWPFVRGNHRSPVISPHKGQWRGDLIFLICAWINGWVNNHETGDLRRHRTLYGVTVMTQAFRTCLWHSFCYTSDDVSICLWQFITEKPKSPMRVCNNLMQRSRSYRMESVHDFYLWEYVLHTGFEKKPQPTHLHMTKYFRIQIKYIV